MEKPTKIIHFKKAEHYPTNLTNKAEKNGCKTSRKSCSHERNLSN